VTFSAPPVPTTTTGVDAKAPPKLKRLDTSVPGLTGPPAPVTPPANVPRVYVTAGAVPAGKFTGAKFSANVPPAPPSPERSSAPALVSESLSTPGEGAGPLAGLSGYGDGPHGPVSVFDWDYFRGFVSEVVMPWERWRAHADLLLASYPLGGRDGLVCLTNRPPVSYSQRDRAYILPGTGRRSATFAASDDGRYDWEVAAELLAREYGVRFAVLRTSVEPV
jgi:hypothetical protein